MGKADQDDVMMGDDFVKDSRRGMHTMAGLATRMAQQMTPVRMDSSYSSADDHKYVGGHTTSNSPFA
eukprot:7547382-Prorocentrum_lima.AAC.1